MDGVAAVPMMAGLRVPARRVLPCAAAVGLVALQLSATALAGAGAARTTRTYSATILAASGSYAGASGRLTITLTLDQIGPAGGRAGAEYRVLITLRGASCAPRGSARPRRRCLALSGAIHGRGEQRLVNPDTAPEIVLSAASGQIRSLGRVGVRGQLRGTGFIRRARRTARLTLTARTGTLSVYGEGPLVPGFAAP